MNDQATTEQAAAKKAAAKKATAKKATSKKATAKKATGKRASAKQAAAKQASAKQAPAKKSAAKKVAAEKSTAGKQAAGKRAAPKQATAKQATAKKSAAEKSAAEKAAAKKAAAKKATGKRASARPPLEKGPGGVVLLSGGNPQIPKGDGRAPVQAYLDAMPGWKHDVGVALDAVIVRTLPDAHQRVRWNSPFYGADDDTWFVSMHCLDKAVRVTFCQGESLDPQPAKGSKVAGVRYHDVGEDDEIDEAQFASWIEQASRLPGDRF